MSPYQEVHQTKNTNEVKNMIDIINFRQKNPQKLQEITRQVILQSLKCRYQLKSIPLPLPHRLLTYLQYPELSILWNFSTDINAAKRRRKITDLASRATDQNPLYDNKDFLESPLLIDFEKVSNDRSSRTVSVQKGKTCQVIMSHLAFDQSPPVWQAQCYQLKLPRAHTEPPFFSAKSWIFPNFYAKWKKEKRKNTENALKRRPISS